MVSYGHWRQDPDYTQWVGEQPGSSPSRTTAFNGYGLSYAEATVEQEGEPYRVTVADLREIYRQAYRAPDDPSSSILTVTGVNLGQGYRASLPTHYSDWHAAVARLRYDIYSASDPRSPIGPWYWGPEYWTEPDAIGVEYEGFPYNPDDPFQFAPAAEVALHLLDTTELSAEVQDSTTGSKSLAVGYTTDIWVSGAEFKTVVAQIDGHTTYTGGAPVERQLGALIDLTALLGPGGWSGQVWTESSFVAPSVTTVDGFVDYGWGITDLRVQWTLRPPAYRYVYASVPRPAPRRVFPRDDGLAGGAPRTYPPSKGVQSSNRIVGGYL